MGTINGGFSRKSQIRRYEKLKWGREEKGGGGRRGGEKSEMIR